MPPRPSPTARQVRLGVELRKLRERAGLTARAAGELLGANQARISNIETGRYGLSEQRVRTLAANYDCQDEALITALVDMAGERKSGWWEEYRNLLPSRIVDLSEFEHHARGFRVAQAINVPGLLQTADYARAVFNEAVPQLSPPDVEFRVMHRIKRQTALFKEAAPALTAILHESVLHMNFGGPRVMRAQLAQLLKVSEQGNITVLAIPFKGRAFPPTGHGVDYLYGSVPQLDTVLLDGVHGGALADASAQLEKYRLVLDRMEEATVPPTETRDLIHSIMQST